MTTAFARRAFLRSTPAPWLLPRLIGQGRALELLISGRTFTSEEAATLGLVHHVVETDAVVPSALEYAGDLAANCSPASMRSIQAQVRGMGAATADRHRRG